MKPLSQKVMATLLRNMLDENNKASKVLIKASCHAKNTRNTSPCLILLPEQA